MQVVRHLVWVGLMATAGLVMGCEKHTEVQPVSSASAPTASLSPSSAEAPTNALGSSSASPSPPAPIVPPDRWGNQTTWKGSLAEQNELMFEQIEAVHKPGTEAMRQLRQIAADSKYLGQGNPKAAVHAMSPDACRRKQAASKMTLRDEEAEAICGGLYMAPLYDPESEKASDARSCIDRFEFPNIPCVYPVTWVSSREAVQLCQAMGKRLCDAHEWEGACAGRLTEPDYDFELSKRMKQDDALRAMRRRQNHRIAKSKRWAYGTEYKKGICATGSRKSKRCGVGWRRCGTNTYPAGSFPACVSPLGVYDIHGNAAEHMNLPVLAEQMASSPTQTYGHTEMKGSWFVFDQIRAHDDHCRWRAPYWHGGRVMSKGSHRNYHLGFRCCKSVQASESE